MTRGGGQARVWFELRCASCTAGLDLGEDMWREAAQLLGSDIGLFYAEQQQFLEAALSVVASSNGLTNLKGVLEGVLGRLDHTRAAFVCLAISNILAWMGDFEDAAAFLEDAMALVPTAAVKENQWLGVLHCNRALCRLRAGDSEGAMADARRAVQLRPDWHRAHARIGCVLAEGGQWEAAMAHFQAALALCQRDSPESLDVAAYMAVARTRGAPSKDGPETLERCLNSGADATARRGGSRGAGPSSSGRLSHDGGSSGSAVRSARSASAGALDRADSNTSLQEGSGDEDGRPAAATYGRSRRVPRPTRRNSHGSGSLRGGARCAPTFLHERWATSFTSRAPPDASCAPHPCARAPAEDGGGGGELTGSRSTRSSLHDEDEEERKRGSMPRKRSKQSLGDMAVLDSELAMPGPGAGVADGALISSRAGNNNMFFEDSLVVGDPFALPGVGAFPPLKRGAGAWAPGESLNGSPLDGDEFLLGWDVVGALETGGLDDN